jgi:hypothetical protein
VQISAIGALERQNFFVVSLTLALIAMAMARNESIPSLAIQMFISRNRWDSFYEKRKERNEQY